MPIAGRVRHFLRFSGHREHRYYVTALIVGAAGSIDLALARRVVATPLADRSTQNLKSSQGMHAPCEIGWPEELAPARAVLGDPVSSVVVGQVDGLNGGLGTVASK